MTNHNNLNEININDDHSYEKQTDNSVVGEKISVYFKNQIEHLIKYIEKADVVIGCVAWLTNTQILEAFKKVPHGCKIIVQKEDFLRPDGSKIGSKQFYDIYNSIPAF
jgi:hypothetical protein